MKRWIILPGLLYLMACNPAAEKNTTTNVDSLAIINKPDSITTANNIDTVNIRPVPANKLIVAGQSIGLTRIGQKSSQLIAVLGTPDDGDAAMGKSLSTWYSKNNPQYKTQVFSSIQFGADEDQPRVKSIRVNNPFFETASGLKAGSSRADIEKEFPGLLLIGSYTSAPGNVKVFDDIVRGIAFEINEQNNCAGICVHTKEEKGFLQYIPFENNFKTIDN
jgi:hypothetical protein